MRGKVYPQFQKLRHVRITPAYAGKSIYQRKKYRDRLDHPRLCGEKEERNPSDYVLLGSPPPMRGKDTTGKNLTMTAGITPAYAGKSYRSESWNFHLTGSPPPMRGKAFVSVIKTSSTGITPAYAGKS